ncbi:GL26687 [Drosophila persimilis]|uniref:GL26687 n=2 Tax=Drosophila persimilis TaxID=7234 RepID=B4GT96_DROPE|nr:GL26687 [Drosophila persimilis]
MDEEVVTESTPPTTIGAHDPNTPGTNPSPPTVPPTTTGLMDLMTYLPEYNNGGDPYVSPGPSHKPGSRHVKAHDGFDSLKTEKYWSHWNDRFTTDNDILQ